MNMPAGNTENINACDSKILQRVFTEYPYRSLSRSAYFWRSYGMLLLVIVPLFLFEFYIFAGFMPGYDDRYSIFLVPLVLLFNHLAFQFRWSPWVTAILRVWALAWLAFYLFYIIYLHHIFVPRVPTWIG